MELTQEQLDEIEKCRREPWYFHNKYYSYEGKRELTEDEYWEYRASSELLWFKPRHPYSKLEMVKKLAKQLKQQHDENNP